MDPMFRCETARIALGTVQSGADRRPFHRALLSVLERSGVDVQSFHYQARFAGSDEALKITGRRQRHLDSWVMQRDQCRHLFSHAMNGADLALLDGIYDESPPVGRRGGSLNTLCQWLDVPQLIVLDARWMATCRLPGLPSNAEGVLLDQVPSTREYCRIRAHVEGLLGVPVLGWLPRRTGPIDGTPDVGDLESEQVEALGSALVPQLDFERLVALATRRTDIGGRASTIGRRSAFQPVSVAVAYDDAFRCFFPDMIDVLESQGAEVSVFSPLAGERLPPDTDVVYLGCGTLEPHLSRLATDICFKEALWSHIVSGGRIYAEGAGLAYLCREIVTPGGQHWPMVGLLPARARAHPSPPCDRPVELEVEGDSWLLSAGDRLRGYLGARWIIHPDGCLKPLVRNAEHRYDLVGDRQLVGSRVHLDLAAFPTLIDRIVHRAHPRPLDAVI